MFVKICGVRDVATAQAIAAAGASAIGLNFYERSPRCVTVETARQIAATISPAVQRVGVFVNHTAEDVVRIAREVRLDAVQLHGDESSEVLRAISEQCSQIAIYRAWRMGSDGLGMLWEHLAACDAIGVRITAVLLDAHAPGTYGGTGQRLPWDEVHEKYDQSKWPRLILAGGLTPENVADAIRIVQPWGVDTASGVESSPGVKDLERVQDFIDSARTGRAMP